MKVIKIFLFVGVILLILAGLILNWGEKNPEIETNTNQDTTSASVTEDKDGKIVYKNTEYGFQISLSDSWKGFKTVFDEWEGDSVNSAGGVDIGTEHGPMILVRHPKWTEKTPRQDIPVMIFTRAQWEDMTTEKFHIGAGPVSPPEIGRNTKYIFALPARYNYTYMEGYEDVEQILSRGSFKTFFQ